MPIQLTEWEKDRILDGLLVVSILLFIFGVVTPSVPRKTQDPPQSVYAPSHLSQLTVADRPQFEELQVVGSSGSQSNTTVAVAGSASSPVSNSSVAASPAASNAGQAATNAKPVSLSSVLSGVLKQLL